MADATQTKGDWLKVFCPDARCLSDEEVAVLPLEAREHPEVAGKAGVWMEVLCPDSACYIEKDKVEVRVKLKVGPEQKSEVELAKRGFWMNLFCPADRCFVREPTDLP